MPLIRSAVAWSLLVDSLAFICMGGALLWVKREVDVLAAAVSVLIRKYEAIQTELAAQRDRRGRDPEREPWSVVD